MGDNSFSATVLFALSQLTSLQSLNIGSECFGLIDSFSLDGLNKLTSVSIGDGAFANSTSFNVTNLESLQTLNIGNECFDNVDSLQLEGLNSLNSLKIGENSFTQKKDDYGDDKNRSFHIKNCKSIESIEIGKFSFSDYSGQFELTNLPSLQSIRIGKVNETSLNFYASSLEIRGITSQLK